MSDKITFFTAFVAGIVSFLSPCVLPLIPAYLSYISGVSIEELKNYDKLTSTVRLKLFFRSLVFVLGFSSVFVAMGASATFIGRFLITYLSILMKIAGVIIIIFGFNMIGLIKIPFLYYEKRFNISTKISSWLSVFLMGAAFAFGWTPCVGPFLAAILTQAARQETVMMGILLLTIYSLGLGLPFIFAGVLTGIFFGFVSGMRRFFRLIEIIGGILLILIGILVFFGRLSQIASFLQTLFPFLGFLG